MDEVTRVRLPSGEEKLVPCPTLEKSLAECLREKGPAIRRAIRRHREKSRKDWFLWIIHNR